MEYISVVDYIRKRDSKRDKNGIAIEFDGNRITREEYWNYIDHYKRYFISQGFFYGCQKPVTICNLNAPEYEFMYMALLELGAIPSTVSISFFKSDVKMHSIEKGADTIILSAEYITPDLKESLKVLGDNGNTNIKKIIFTSAGDYRMELKQDSYNAQFDFKSMIEYLDLPKNIEIVYPSAIKNQKNNLIALPTEEESISLLDRKATYSNTGGTTTGVPNCSVHTHRAIIALCQSHEEDVCPDFNVKESQKTLLLIPISHITSQFLALFTRRAAGATMVYNPGAFDPVEITKALVEDEINDVIAPFGLYVAVAHSDLKPGDLKHLTPSCGGEPTPLGPTKLVNEKLKKVGSEPIIIGAGSTEFGSVTMASYGIEDRTNEAGFAIPGSETKIINPYTWKEAQMGERGIIYTRCPWQMEGYLNDEKATKGFFNFVDEDGVTWGTNNDIGKVVREYKGQPIYSIDGRLSSYVVREKDSKRYYPGISFTDGKANTVDLSKGEFLFDMRDRLLNVPGVIEAEALLIPYDDISKVGTPVVNLVVIPEISIVDIIKYVYSSYQAEEEFIPEGLIFRTNFARSLSTDKREIVSLKNERATYYNVDNTGNIIGVTLPKNGEPIYNIIENLDEIKRVTPPEPQKILVKKQ